MVGVLVMAENVSFSIYTSSQRASTCCIGYQARVISRCVCYCADQTWLARKVRWGLISK